MTKVEEIENIVQSLSQEEFRALFDWMSARDNELWDQQFENDVVSGKLESLGNDALADFRAGKCQTL